MANLALRDPFDMTGSFNALRQQMDRFFDEAWRMGNAWSDQGTLPVDIYEQDGTVVVEASVPGFTRDEIDVQVHEGVLAITARKEREHEEQGVRWYRRERHYGALSRRIALPGIVEEAPVEAVLQDGVLRLTVPLPRRAQPKRIEIKSTEAAEGQAQLANGQAKPEAAGVTS